MANGLTTELALAMSGPTIDGTLFRVRGELKEGGTTVDITARVVTFGRVLERAYHCSRRERAQWQWPIMEWEVRNEDGFFTEGFAGSIWGSDIPQIWTARYVYEERVQDPNWLPLKEYAFHVTDVRKRGERVHLVSEHPLRRSWARVWTRGDEVAVNWGIVSRSVTL